jgi:hypothetical protein
LHTRDHPLAMDDANDRGRLESLPAMLFLPLHLLHGAAIAAWVGPGLAMSSTAILMAGLASFFSLSCFPPEKSTCLIRRRGEYGRTNAPMVHRPRNSGAVGTNKITPMRSPSENMRCDGATPSTQILLECRNRKKSSPITPSASEIAHAGWRQRTQRGSGEPPCLPGRSRCCRAAQCAGAVFGRSAESGAPSRAAVGGPTGQGSTADRRMDSLSKRARLRRVGRY